MVPISLESDVIYIDGKEALRIIALVFLKPSLSPRIPPLIPNAFSLSNPIRRQMNANIQFAENQKLLSMIQFQSVEFTEFSFHEQIEMICPFIRQILSN
jgi:hypothetical protein